MRFVRYKDEERIKYGILEGEKIKEIIGSLPFGRPLQNPAGDLSVIETGRSSKLESAELLWPCEPSKILAVGWNYKSHLASHNRPEPKSPQFFLVPPSALLQHGGEIKLPPDAEDVHYEGELVIVIGKETRNVPVEEAEAHIFGYTCGNDISERNWQKNDLQWWRAKGCDTFAPLGPVIATDFDWRKGRVETRVNGKTVQSGGFVELLFNPPQLVSYASRYVTLYPGDVIYSGTPGDTAALKPGDTVEVDIPGLGLLINWVAGESEQA